jgi:prepilin-type N-terminal cleavage/methylation domain-containing protein
MGVQDNLRFRVAGRQRHASGFTLPEFMIAMAIGLGVLAAAGSAYLFVSKNGKALSSQIAFSDKARVLQSRFIELVESSSSLITDGTPNGIELLVNGETEWIGYIANDDPAQSAIVYRPNGKESAEGQQILCTNVGPAYKVDGETPDMFTPLSSTQRSAILLNVHIGDPESGTDTTGPGRQGVVVSIVASSRDLRRKL